MDSGHSPRLPLGGMPGRLGIDKEEARYDAARASLCRAFGRADACLGLVVADSVLLRGARRGQRLGHPGDAHGRQPVPAGPSGRETPVSAVLDVKATLQPDTEYLLEVEPTLADWAGNLIENPISISFRTANTARLYSPNPRDCDFWGRGVACLDLDADGFDDPSVPIYLRHPFREGQALFFSSRPTSVRRASSDLSNRLFRGLLAS